MILTPTQQELNVRFAKALGWIHCNSGIQIGSIWKSTHWVNSNNATEVAHEPPNYFAPENFHLVRAAVEELPSREQEKFFYNLLCPQNLCGFQPEYYAKQGLLSPVEHIITAYLKVKGVN